MLHVVKVFVAAGALLQFARPPANSLALGTAFLSCMNAIRVA